MFMLRIRFDTFCTVPVIASLAPMRWAKQISQPSQACRLLACASRAIGVISTSEKRPESLSSCRNRSLRWASRSCSSGRAPRIAPSRLVSINSKSKTAIDCATVGPQLTNNKAHNVTRYDRMIMLGPLEPSARARVPWSFVAPRACAVVAFGRPRFGTALVECTLQCRPAAPRRGRSRRAPGPAADHCGSSAQLRCEISLQIKHGNGGLRACGANYLRTRDKKRLDVLATCHLRMRRHEAVARFALPHQRARQRERVLQPRRPAQRDVEKGVAEIGPFGAILAA